MSVAVFWDRDKTLIEDPGYISSRDQVSLLAGAAEALKRLSAAGFQNIIATNQSGVARGLLDEPTLESIHQRVRELFAAEGATIDAIYYCPYLPGDEAVVEAYRQDSDLRKPRPGMFLKAALERKIDLAGSWSIGDSLRDAQAGRAAGCRTIVIAPDAASQAEMGQHKEVDFVAGSLAEAADLVLKYSRPTAGGGEPAEADATGTLQEILNFLRMVDRRHQSTDISMAGLVGMLFQALAFVSFIWAFFGVINVEASYTEAMMRLLMTITLQLMAMTFFLLASKR